jgi:hypothetical protein
MASYYRKQADNLKKIVSNNLVNYSSMKEKLLNVEIHREPPKNLAKFIDDLLPSN